MQALNCRLGDLAITIKAELPENLGNIVRVTGVRGIEEWWGFKTPIFIWEVETVQGVRLVYEHADGRREYASVGLIPDVFLKPIAPTYRSRREQREECYVS
jgi:hypothetical protein